MQWQNVLYFLVWAGLFFVTMRFGCGAHIMGHGHHHDDEQGTDNDLRRAPPEKVTDPVCGMTIQVADAKSTIYGGQVYYFCSQECREKFEAAPKQFMKSAQSVPHTQEGHHHGCC